MAQALLLECAKREGSSSRVSPVDCHVSTYDEAVYMTSTYDVRTDDVSPYDETEPRQPSGVDETDETDKTEPRQPSDADAACAAPTAQRADETDADETDDDDDSVLAGLPDPFRPEVARRAYVFSEGLQAEYRARRRCAGWSARACCSGTTRASCAGRY